MYIHMQTHRKRKERQAKTMEMTLSALKISNVLKKILENIIRDLVGYFCCFVIIVTFFKGVAGRGYPHFPNQI